ncbi:MAG TPA: hypothetical protein VM123_20425 [archaeon]|nr:hypothetical protein [archaeon]
MIDKKARASKPNPGFFINRESQKIFKELIPWELPQDFSNMDITTEN